MDLFAELKRRNVFRVTAAYIVVAWLVMQVGDTMAPALNLDESVNSVLAFFLILGLPIVVFITWVFEMTPEGVKFERDIDRNDSITPQTGKKVDRLIIVVLVIAVAYFAVDKFVLAPVPVTEPVPEVAESVEPSISDQSIAVLPFADLSPDGDQEYFSDGIAEEILNVLVRVEDLSVASRTSSFGFKGQESLGIPTIAEKLKVRHVLEGSVRKAGDTVRITAQLIDAQTDAHLWSETYDRDLTAENIFAIQDEIAQAIVGQLGVLIDESPIPAGTDNLDAYELYLRAHQVFITRSDVPGAIDLFEQTVAADPTFARAVAGLAASYAIAPSWGVVDRDYLTMAREAAERAIEIDDSLALPYAVLAYTSQESGVLDGALENYETALSKNDKDPTVWLWRGILYNIVGYFDLGAADLQRCLEIDFAYQNCRRHLARNALYQGDYDRAISLIEQALRAGFPNVNPMFLRLYAERGNHSFVLAYLSQQHNARGNAALVDYEYRAFTDPDFDFEAERAEIETVYRATTGRELNWGNESEFDPMVFGVFSNSAIQMWWQPWWHPLPREWWDTPERKQQMREAGLPEFWREHGYPPQCRPVGDDDFDCEHPGPVRANERTPVGAPR